MRTRKFIPTEEWEDARQVRGLAGERAAMAYLVSCGYEIEAHRHRLGRHDIDLIIRRGSVVAFVEVKTRRSAACGQPAEAVGRAKQRAIGRVAEIWCLRYGRPGDTYRFDLVAVEELGSGEKRITHVEDAWRV
ncbi:MAG: YraN family protein [Gemmatimonadales bacterium]